MNTLKLVIAIAISCLSLTACGTNCHESERMGDFEFSQRNYARAAKLYAEAWAADSLACPEAQEKLDNIKMLKP